MDDVRECKKCARPITGPAFGSPETGWVHPFDDCPTLTVPNTQERAMCSGSRVAVLGDGTVGWCPGCEACRAALAETVELLPDDDTAQLLRLARAVRRVRDESRLIRGPGWEPVFDAIYREAGEQ